MDDLMAEIFVCAYIGLIFSVPAIAAINTLFGTGIDINGETFLSASFLIGMLAAINS